MDREIYVKSPKLCIFMIRLHFDVDDQLSFNLDLFVLLHSCTNLSSLRISAQSTCSVKFGSHFNADQSKFREADITVHVI